MIYLDNAATTFPKPPSVISEINFCLEKYCGNPGRSSHFLSIRSSEAIYSTREKVADLLGVDTPEQIVFTYNATYALNIAIKTIVSEKCHILTSDFEHNSVIRPLESLSKRLGVEYTTFSADGDIYESLRTNLRKDTRAIICSIASNVTGNNIPLEILSNFAKEHALYLIIDASQAIGHIDIDLKKTPCDALCAPGHKGLFGIQGTGFVYFSEKRRRESFIEGGSGSESGSDTMPILLPEGYEAGTLATPSIVSLGAGIDFINEIGITEINKRLWTMTDMIYDRLDSIKGVTIYKPGCGIVSFNYKGMESSMLSSMLDRYGVCVRGGLHYAPSVHRKIGTISRGAVRASLSYLNSTNDVDSFYSAIRDITSKI